VPSYHPVIVSSLISGRLDELNVLESSKVKIGDIIAVLYQKDIKDELARTAAELKSSEANLARLSAGYRIQEKEQAKSDYSAAIADRDLMDRIFKRTASLVKSGAVSEEELDKDRAAFEVASARCDTLKQAMLLKEEGFRVEEIDAAKAEVEKHKAQLTLAKNRLEYTVIRSPMDGVVLERFVTPGTYIPASNPKIVSLYNPNDLQVRADVRQENLSGVFIGQTVEIFTDIDPGKPFNGEVIRVDPKADFKKNTIQAKIRILNPSEDLHPEMIVRVKFIRSNDE